LGWKDERRGKAKMVKKKGKTNRETIKQNKTNKPKFQ
jgi:hypothetical protein